MSEKWNMRGNKASMVCGRIGGCGVVTEKHSMVKHRKGRATALQFFRLAASVADKTLL